jgi:hypothetical protein
MKYDQFYFIDDRLLSSYYRVKELNLIWEVKLKTGTATVCFTDYSKLNVLQVVWF